MYDYRIIDIARYRFILKRSACACCIAQSYHEAHFLPVSGESKYLHSALEFIETLLQRPMTQNVRP